MAYFSDPTADRAVGSISREWNRMARLAEQIRKEPNSPWALEQRRRFTGIFKALLDDPEDTARSRAS